jgi:hypothetical protein
VFFVVAGQRRTSSIFFFYQSTHTQDCLFGIVDREAQDFAISCLTPLIPAEFWYSTKQLKSLCLLRFSLGKLAGWVPRESIELQNLGELKLCEIVSAAVRNQLFPVISAVVDRKSFLKFLQEESDKLSELGVNLATKTAYIGFLLRAQGVGVPQIQDQLLSISTEYVQWFEGQKIDREFFVRSVARKLAALT